MAIHEQMNQLADALCGYREASFEQMIQRVNALKVSEAILLTSQAALSRRTAIKDACDTLLAEIESLAQGE